MPKGQRELRYDSRALGYLRGLTAKLARQIAKKIDQLPLDPKPRGSKKLKGLAFGGRAVYRIRHGNHRILYVYDDVEVLITNINDRKDVYG